ncbi:hypothetical protein CRM22_009468 [Opisthorchis felineus]|uniref:Leucine-rich repeat-containing protein 27 n=1 Tax=Opisthorchis felineus TaxID=147828 RepID=A0A4S2LEJ4_OPIFE|nr:hypothetical protein CRM22_009468 [Opisthorchis felineus]
MAQTTEPSDFTHSIESERPNLVVAAERIKKAEDLLCEKLNLSKLRLVEIPVSVLDLTHIRKLYLAQNMLFQLPDCIFTHLSRLTWLDLRENLLSCLPNSIKCLSSLRVLLIDDNRIRVLPFELGLLKKLKSLHLRNNPIEFPPKQIIESGAKTLMRYLLDCYVSREHPCAQKGKTFRKTIADEQDRPNSNFNNPCETILDPANGGSNPEDSVDKIDLVKHVSLNANTKDDFKDKQKAEGSRNSVLSEANERNEDSFKSTGCGDANCLAKFVTNLNLEDQQNVTTEEDSDPPPNLLESKSLVYRKVESAYLHNRRKTRKPVGTTAFAIYPSQSARHEALLPDEPSMPSLKQIRTRYMNEKKRKFRQKILATRQTAVQKLKDAERIRSWRQEYLDQQRRKIWEYLQKNEQEIKHESSIRMLGAPFDVGEADLQVIGSNELHTIRQKTLGPSPKPEPLDPHVTFQLEMARQVWLSLFDIFYTCGKR